MKELKSEATSKGYGNIEHCKEVRFNRPLGDINSGYKVKLEQYINTRLNNLVVGEIEVTGLEKEGYMVVTLRVRVLNKYLDGLVRHRFESFNCQKSIERMQYNASAEYGYSAYSGTIVGIESVQIHRPSKKLVKYNLKGHE